MPILHPPCPFQRSTFLNLSAELHLLIISYLSVSDKRRLARVCQLFNNLLILDLPLEELRAAQRNQTIFLTKDVEEKDVGFEPFIITNVRKIHNESKAADTSAGSGSLILLDIYYPKYMRNDEQDHPSEPDEFPELSAGCAWPMPCPVCIGYETADKARNIHYHKDPEDLYKLWKRIKRMLAEEEYEELGKLWSQIEEMLGKYESESESDEDSQSWSNED
ncbi:hypothetical protein B0H11DRAFT_2241921 [Mycena galericulata]|nr:hypothetical protein B0H11DRAFT_2241921 [Mycena galericulata]